MLCCGWSVCAQELKLDLTPKPGKKKYQSAGKIRLRVWVDDKPGTDGADAGAIEEDGGLGRESPGEDDSKLAEESNEMDIALPDEILPGDWGVHVCVYEAKDIRASDPNGCRSSVTIKCGDDSATSETAPQVEAERKGQRACKMCGWVRGGSGKEEAGRHELCVMLRRTHTHAHARAHTHTHTRVTSSRRQAKYGENVSVPHTIRMLTLLALTWTPPKTIAFLFSQNKATSAVWHETFQFRTPITSRADFQTLSVALSIEEEHTFTRRTLGSIELPLAFIYSLRHHSLKVTRE